MSARRNSGEAKRRRFPTIASDDWSSLNEDRDRFMFKPITLKPVAYLSLLLGVFFVVTYLLFRNYGANSVPTPDWSFFPHSERTKYKAIHEILEDVSKNQTVRDYQTIIDILKSVHDHDFEKLALSEISNPPPRLIVIGDEGSRIHGVEDLKDLLTKYKCKFVSFPGTSGVVTDPGHDFWILYAIDFTTKYNARLAADIKSINP